MKEKDIMKWANNNERLARKSFEKWLKERYGRLSIEKMKSYPSNKWPIMNKINELVEAVNEIRDKRR